MMPDTVIIKSSIVSRMIILIILSPLCFAIVYFAVNRVFWIVPLILAFVGYLYCDVATSIVTLKRDEIIFSHFCRLKWVAKLTDSKIKHELGGDLGVLPILAIRAKHSRKLVGVINKNYFSTASLKIIEDWVAYNSKD